MTSLWSRMQAAFRAFRDPYVVTNLLNNDDFADWNGRLLRYAICWSFYENTAYRNIHNWAVRYKVDYSLYRYIRNIYNPAGRLGDFWQTHLMGGLLDWDAGDGTVKPSALPIITENELLRPAIAQVWEWSNWQAKKDLYTLYGPTMGDVALKVVDNPQKEKVYIEVLHPRVLKEVYKDSFGHVKSYVIEEQRDDPRPTAGDRDVTYTEIAYREGDDVIYQTLLNGAPFAWNDIAAEWKEPYGFIPLVHVPHIDVGDTSGGWGWAEMHKMRSKIHEADDLASKLHDQIRKTVDAMWLFAGVAKSKTDPTQSTATSSTDRPDPGREEILALYSPDANAKAQPLVADLPIAETGAEIKNVLSELEREYPELQLDIYANSGDTSGRAMLVARQKSETKVEMRRGGYDRGLQDAHQMAVAIAGFRGYLPEVFGRFNLDSYERGDLDHTIGKRPVFAVDERMQLEENKLFWEAAAIAIEKTGIPLESYLEAQGWSEEKIRLITRRQQRAAIAEVRRTARRTPVTPIAPAPATEGETGTATENVTAQETETPMIESQENE